MMAALEDGNHKIVHITKHPSFMHNNNQYGNSTPDVEFLKTLGSDSVRWIVISADSEILHSAHERAALNESGLTFFALDYHFEKCGAYEQAAKLTKVWPEILQHAQASHSSIYEVNMGRKPYIKLVAAGTKK